MCTAGWVLNVFVLRHSNMWKAYTIVADGFMVSAFLSCYCSEGIKEFMVDFIKTMQGQINPK